MAAPLALAAQVSTKPCPFSFLCAQTVIPNIGGKVLVVNGAYEGSVGRIVSVDMDKFCAQIKLDSGTWAGKTVDALPYEDFSKYSKDN